MLLPQILQSIFQKWGMSLSPAARLLREAQALQIIRRHTCVYFIKYRVRFLKAVASCEHIIIHFFIYIIMDSSFLR